MKSRRLVIDPGVGQASGKGKASDIRSKSCRDLLDEVYRLKHQMVMTRDIRIEWNRHRSEYAQAWYFLMRQNGQIFDSPLGQNEALRKRINRTVSNEQESDAILKDCHLVEAALETDKTIVSLDKIAKSLFIRAAKTVGELRAIIWVNPELVDTEPLVWLAAISDRNKYKVKQADSRFLLSVEDE